MTYVKFKESYMPKPVVRATNVSIDKAVEFYNLNGSDIEWWYECDENGNPIKGC